MEKPKNSFENFPDWIIEKWQELTDVLAEIIGIPSALIMKTDNELMEVFISSKTENNPYHVGDKEKWHGLYCETVIKTQNKLLIPNATVDKDWDNNPDIKHGMIAYLGFPINFPNNQPFGTICLLDSKENHFSSKHEKLVLQFKNVIELDLALIQTFDIQTKELAKTINEHQLQLIEKNIELQKAKEKAEDSEERYRLLHENAGIGIGYYTPEGIVISFNSLAAKYMNGKPNDFKGKSIFEIFPKNEADFYFDRIKKALISDESNVYEDFVDLLTEQKSFLSTFTKIINSKGKILGVQIISQDISKNKAIENRLIQSEEKFRTLFETCPDGIAMTTMTGEIVEANQALLQQLGLSSDELKNTNFSDITPSKWHKQEQENIAFNMKTGKPLYFEKEFIKKNGAIYPIALTGWSIKDEHGKSKYLGAFVKDITEQKLAENELSKAKEKIEESEAYFKILFEKSPDYIIISNLKGEFINCNEATLKFHNVNSITDLQNYKTSDIYVFPDERIQTITEIIKSGFLRNKETKFKSLASNIEIDSLVSVEMLKSIEKEPIFITSIRDISEIKKQENLLKEAKEKAEINNSKIQTIIDNFPNGSITLLDRNLTIQITGGTEYSKFSINKEKFINKHLNVLLSPEIFELNISQIIEAFNGISSNYYVDYNGFYYINYVFPIIGNNNEIENVLLMASNITDLKTREFELIKAKEKAEESEVKLKNALAELNQLYDHSLRYQTLFENAIDGIFILDKNGSIVSVNQSYATMHGYTIEEVLKMSLFDIDKLFDENSIKEKVQNIINGNSMRFESEHYHKNGHKIIVDISACAFKSNNENFVVAFHQDITEKKKNEKQLQQESVFAIIKGEEIERTRISQELHDGLGPLMSTLKLFMQGIGRVEEPAKIKDFAQKAQSVFIEIMQTITEVSNNLSPHILRQFGLFTALKTYIDKIKKTTDINIIFDFNYSHFQNSVCNKTQQLCKLTNRFNEIYEITLYRIIAELIHNTIKHSKATEISLKIHKQNHSLIVIYTDNGTGFDASRVLSQNSGLGLSNMQNRVKNINGTITFESVPNKGFSAEIVIDCACKSY